MHAGSDNVLVHVTTLIELDPDTDRVILHQDLLHNVSQLPTSVKVVLGLPSPVLSTLLSI